MYIYRTYFKLIEDVIDLSDAQEYLLEDDMVKYLKEDTRIQEYIRNSVEKIEWHLITENSGYIELITNKELSDIELKEISAWVSGQNSDGLGEGFEQQEFAHYPKDNYEDDYDYNYGDNCVMASFDWNTNEYIFELYKTL